MTTTLASQLSPARLRALGLAALLTACSSAPAEQARAGAAGLDSLPTHVLLVANGVSGTVSFLDVDDPAFSNVGTVDVVPDLQDRLAAISADPVHWAAYQLITAAEKIPHFEPSGGQRFVDDAMLSPDGTTLYVSRGNLGDVAAFDLTSPDHPMLWRTDVPGYKADHTSLSPDGTRLVVSASVVAKVEVLDAASGAIVGAFGTGPVAHQNDYSADGSHIYDGNIGIVSLPSVLDFTQGPFLLTVADATTFEVVKTYSFPQGVRPTVVTPDETTAYVQQSYMNGFVVVDLTAPAGEASIVGSYDEPLSDFAVATYPTRDDYPHKSAHHGLALSGDGTRLCDVGTIDDTVSIVSTDDLSLQSRVDVGHAPYWATTSPDGNLCFVSVAGDDAVAVIDYASGRQIARVPVGTFPQRNRLGRVPAAVLDALSAGP